MQIQHNKNYARYTIVKKSQNTQENNIVDL